MSNKQAGLDEQVKQLEDAIRKRDATNEGGEVRFLCPSHDDNNPSARWNPEKLVWCCDACGAGGSWRDLFMELGLGELSTTSGRTTVYSVRDADGVEVAQHRRTDNDDGSKTFAWYRDGTSGLKEMKVADLPLYGTETLSRADPDELIYVVEGEKAADALRRHSLYALGTVTGAKGRTPSASVLEVLTGRDVVLLPDNDDPGRAHMQRVAQVAHPLARRVRVLELPELTEKGDAADWVVGNEGKGLDSEQICDALHGLVDLAPDWCPPENGDEEPTCEGVTTKEKESKKLINLASDAELFHTPALETFATILQGDHFETLSLRGEEFRRWLNYSFYLAEDKPPGGQALSDAIRTLRGKAIFEGERIPVFIRVGEHADSVVLDLGSEEWDAAVMDDKGYRVETSPPAKFHRAPGMLALPRPASGGSLELLKNYLNLPDEDAFVLLVAWLVGALHPRGPYPILILQGEQGSAKSTACRILRTILDAAKATLQSIPRSERDLAIAANNSWILVFDNLSRLPRWAPDALCRLSTGGGLRTRELFTDTSEIIFDARRPVILNGITNVANSADLLDRAIIITLPPISDSRRRTENQLWTEFREDHPRILGALLDAVSTALRRQSEIDEVDMPRMADFFTWVVAAEPALPWEEGGFLEAYAESRAEAVEQALEGDLVAQQIRAMVDELGDVETTAAYLLKDLNHQVSDQVKRLRAWPKSSSALSNQLRRASDSLRKVGIEVEFGVRRANERPLFIRRVDGTGGDPEATSRERLSVSDDDAEGRDGLKARRRHPESPAPDGPDDDDDGDDDNLQSLRRRARTGKGQPSKPEFRKPNLKKLKKLIEEESREERLLDLELGPGRKNGYVP